MKKITSLLAVILTVNISFGQIQKATTENGRTVILNTNGTWKYSDGYNYNSHNDFKVFWADFKKAIAAGDKQSLSEMTRFPFSDFNELAYERVGLTCKTKTEFSTKFSKIFPSCAIIKITNGQPMKIDSDHEVNTEQNVGAEIWLFLGGDCDSSENMIAGYVFGKYNGIYKLLGLKYLP